MLCPLQTVVASTTSTMKLLKLRASQKLFVVALGTIIFLCFGSMFFLPADQVFKYQLISMKKTFQTSGGNVKVEAQALQVGDQRRHENKTKICLIELI